MNWDWLNGVFGAVGAMIGAGIALATSVWRIARIDSEIRKDLTQEFAEAMQELGLKVEKAGHEFDETLRGLREKINSVELDAYKNFVAKSDFDDFRREYREDMRDLKHSMAEIIRGQP